MTVFVSYSVPLLSPLANINSFNWLLLKDYYSFIACPALKFYISPIEL